jgi:hypothetical protein
MAQRGRKSAASLAIASVTPVTAIIPRPDAPSELDDEEAEEWRAVVDRLPAHWFPRETHGLLTQYCRHVVRARRIAQLIHDAESIEEETDRFPLDDYAKLLRMQQAESRAMAILSTKMRLSQQSTIDKEAKKAGVGKSVPWEIKKS